MDDPKSRPEHGLISAEHGALATAPDLLDFLKAVPEEDVWLGDQNSKHTRRAYRDAVTDFIRRYHIRDRADFRRVTDAAVVSWKLAMEKEGFKPASIRSRLSALSSLFKHLVDKRVADVNPVREINRPNVDRLHGTTASFSQNEARKMLDAPDPTGVQGLRDRAILAVGFYAGCRRSEIAGLTVGSLHTTQGHDALRYTLKGGKEHVVVIHANAAKRIEEYLATAGHKDDVEGPLFRPVRNNARGRQTLRRHLNPDVIDRIVRKYAKNALKKRRGYSAHSMRATFITNALQNGANLEDVQQAVGHADPATTKRYDRRGFNAEKAASFFANY
jgi:site-specific recombinase XerD